MFITLFSRTRINIRSREANRPWVKQVLGILNFGDTSHHCLFSLIIIIIKKATLPTTAGSPLVRKLGPQLIEAAALKVLLNISFIFYLLHLEINPNLFNQICSNAVKHFGGFDLFL